MAFDFNMATEGIKRAVDIYSSQYPDLHKRVKSFRGEAPVGDPWQQKMGEKYLQQNPNEDISSLPGMEDIQAQFEKKKAAQMVPEVGLTDPIIELTGKGFGSRSASKDDVAFNLMNRAELGKKLTKQQEQFLDDYYGRSKSKTELTGRDYESARGLAEDIVKRNKLKQLVDAGKLNPQEDDMGEVLKKIVPTNEEINSVLPEAMKSLFPNVPFSDPNGDEVTVISPEGLYGTMPRENLDMAIKEGYRVVE